MIHHGRIISYVMLPKLLSFSCRIMVLAMPFLWLASQQPKPLSQNGGQLVTSSSYVNDDMLGLSSCHSCQVLRICLHNCRKLEQHKSLIEMEYDMDFQKNRYRKECQVRTSFTGRDDLEDAVMLTWKKVCLAVLSCFTRPSPCNGRLSYDMSGLGIA